MRLILVPKFHLGTREKENLISRKGAKKSQFLKPPGGIRIPQGCKPIAGG